MPNTLATIATHAADPAAAANDGYIRRAFYKVEDVSILKIAALNEQYVLLLGPAGVGKSSLANAAANALGWNYSYIPCHTGATAESLLGQWVPAQNGKGYVWVDGILTSAVRNGGYVLLDEVNSLLPEVAFAVHGLLDHRRELVLTEKPDANGKPEVIKAHENFGLAAAGNLDYEGTRSMNEAFMDRFDIQLHLNYVWKLDMEVLNRLPQWGTLDPAHQGAVQAFVQKTRQAVKDGAIFSDVSTRAFIALLRNIHAFGFQTARMMFVNRFHDESEQTAVRTVFREVWDDKGAVHNAPAGQGRPLTAGGSPNGTGQAGQFAATPNGQTAAAAQASF